MNASAPAERAARRDIRHQDLLALSRLVGTGYCALGTALEGGATVARGAFDLTQVRPGLLLHASDARYQRTMTTRLVKERSLNLSYVLEGEWQASLGGVPLSCDGSRPRAMFFVLSESDLWERHAAQGGHARMVNVMVSPEWLDGNGLDGSDLNAGAVAHLSRLHGKHWQWRPSARAIALAGQILGRPIYTGALQRLYLESRTLDLVLESLAQLTDSSPAPGRAAGRLADERRMRIVRERLDEMGSIPSLAELARHAGLGVRTLQRQFAAMHGVGVLEYARRRRLELARDLLEHEGATVSQAAHRAGYAHPANFATAFNRYFGLPPGRVRRRF